MRQGREVAAMKWFTGMRTDDICFSHNETCFKLLLKIKVQDSVTEPFPILEARRLIRLIALGGLWDETLPRLAGYWRNTAFPQTSEFAAFTVLSPHR